MQFISITFIIFLFLTIIGYYCCEAKHRYIFLLICNVLFYCSWADSIMDFIPLICVILITWLASLIIEVKKSKAILALSIILSFSFLLFYKYANFVLENVNGLSGGVLNIPKTSLIAPVGISFFSFQAVGYLIDVYRGKVKSERNPFRYAAFVSFFPTITSGPIERSTSLLQMLSDMKLKFSFSNIQHGTVLLVYGAFVKLVISNRLSLIVDTVFNNYYAYGGAVLAFSAILYSLQIYCDFSSYSIMALGVSRCLGFNVIENFKAPYFAQSIQEFWRRWHISLSTWFRDYVYISLGGNRCSKFRKNLNLLITFLVSGLWHGANWTFIFWGGLHGVYQIIGNITQPLRKKIMERLKINSDCFSARLGRAIFVFLCTTLAWIFFRANTISDAFGYISIMFSNHQIWQLVDGTLFTLGLSNFEMDILFLGLILMFVVDLKKYKTDKSIAELVIDQNMLFRCLFVALLIVVTFVFGMYGTVFNAQDFIYFNF